MPLSKDKPAQSAEEAAAAEAAALAASEVSFARAVEPCLLTAVPRICFLLLS